MKRNLVAARKGACEAPEFNELSIDELTQIVGGDGASSGAGAGKVTLTPFSVTRKIDFASAHFYTE